MKKLFLSSLFIVILCFSICEAQMLSAYRSNTNVFNTSDYYSNNRWDAVINGRGAAGISARNNILGALINPASVSLDGNIHAYFGYSNKSKLENPDRRVENLHPSFSAAIGYPITDKINAGIIYSVENSYRESFDFFIIDQNEFRNSSLSIPMNYSFFDNLKIGTTLTYLFYSIVPHSKERELKSIKFGIFLFKFGAVFNPISNFSLGLTYSPPMKKTTKEIVEYIGPMPAVIEAITNYCFPSKYGLGMKYSFDSIPLKVLFDYNYHDVPEMENFNPEYSINLGAEYKLTNPIMIRFGAFYQNNYERFNDSYDNTFKDLTFLTIGFTYNISPVDISFSIIDSHLLTGGNAKITVATIGLQLNMEKF